MGEPQVKITLGLARFLHGVLSSHLEHEDLLLDAYMDRHSELDAAISMAEQKEHKELVCVCSSKHLPSSLGNCRHFCPSVFSDKCARCGHAEACHQPASEQGEGEHD